MEGTASAAKAIAPAEAFDRSAGIFLRQKLLFTNLLSIDIVFPHETRIKFDACVIELF
jgi:hypothetical protein